MASHPTWIGTELGRQERLTLFDEGVRSIGQLEVLPCASDSVAAAPQAPVAEMMSGNEYAPQLAACCKFCTVGIACGNTCISARFTCHVGAGCACNAFSSAPVYSPPTISLSVAQQSAYPHLRVGDTAQLTLLADIATFPFVSDGDVEMRVTNMAEAGEGLRGWDGAGLLARNTGGYITSARQAFKPFIQALAPGTYRLRVGFFHKTLGQVGPDGVYWDVVVDPLPNVARLYEGWHSRWVTQSPYLTMTPSQIATFWIRFANAGTETWRRGNWGQQANLALNGDNKEPFRLGMAVNWLWDDRIATTTGTLTNPGEVAEFQFSVRAPSNSGTYYLNLRPVIDGQVWMEDEGVFWIVVVR